MKTFNLKRIIGITVSLTALLVCGGSAELAAQITITYPKSTSGYACVGDTIEVTATAAGIDDLVLPKSAYWSGDANDAAIVKEDGKITKRFYTYHPYMETDPTVNKSREFEFTIRYKNGTVGTDKKNIQAKSCLPSMNPPITDKNPYPQDLSIGNKYNLGIIYFEFTFTNPSSNPTRMRFVPTFNPDQRMELYQQRYSSKRQWEIRYHAIPTSDATYTIDVFYNEGDSLNRKASFGPYTIPLKEELGTLVPDATGYCPGNDIVFSLQLSTKWQEVMNQTINNDESKIGSCFDWSGSPAPVSFTRRDGDKYFFSTKAVSTSAADFRCKMSVLIKYQSDAKAKPAIDASFTQTFDVPITQPKYNEAKGFTTHDAQTVCQGSTLDPSLTQLMDPGATVAYYYRNGNTNDRINTPGKYEPSQSEVVYAAITAPCAWTDQLQINVIDKSKIQSFSIQHDTLICAGDSLSFSATANSPIEWTILYPKGGGTNESIPDDGKSITRAFSAEAMVTATVSNCDTDSKKFKVQVVQRPDVELKPAEQHACPYSQVSLSGTGGSNPTYTLYDLRNKTNLTGSYLSNAGLTNYKIRPNDSLRLTYKAGNSGNASGYTPSSLSCYNSAEAKIIAYPLPAMHITYDGTVYTDGQTACVPREQTFTLTASGAASYEWLDDPSIPSSQAIRTLELKADSLIRVRGENANHCFDTVALNCVVKVEKADRVKTEALCPGAAFCFSADSLPNTTYTWVGPDGRPISNTTHRLCDTAKGAAGNYTYTLTTQRYTCPETLPYTLTIYPAPAIRPTVNNPLCVGEKLVINYHTGLPESETPTHEFTKDGGDPIDIKEGSGDVFIYEKPNVQLSDAGRYIFKVTTLPYSCTDRDTIDLVVEEPAVVRIALEQDTVCEGNQTWVRAEFDIPSDNFTYKWETDNRVIYEDGDHSEIQVLWQRSDNGPLHLTVFQNACSTKADTAVAVIPTPQLIMPKDTGLCQGMSICLTPVSDIEPEEVGWFCIQNNKLIPLPKQSALPYCLDDVDESMSGLYFVIATHTVGSARCFKSSDTIQVTVNKRPDIRIEGPDYICDQSTVILRAVSFTPGTVRWHHNNSTDDVINVSEPGRYEVTRISEYGCQDSTEHYLVARALPYFSLPPDTSICRGTEMMVYGPEDMESYLWSDGLQAKDRLVDEAGLYILTVERNGCSFTDSTRIYMTFCGQFHFPTAFTPNDNRVNDTWGAISAAKDEEMAEFDLMVFDRNGKKVFHGKRITEQWDGRYKGELCPPGVYMYSFKALEKLEGIKYQASGTVTIVQ